MSALQKPAEPYDFAHAPCGGLETRVAGAWIILRTSGAMWMHRESALVAGDLHLEKGSSYAARGQLLPPYDTRETLLKLAADVAATDPRVIVFLGDTLHDGGGQDRMASGDLGFLRDIVRGRTLLWVVGNHDPDGPGQLPGQSVDELDIGGLILRHEPEAGRRPREAAGHLHPCARVVGGGRSVRRRCFVTDGQRIILPAYGAFTGGLNVRNEAYAGLFAHAPLLGALGQKRVHPVGWGSTRGD